jgi:transcriptional regulator with XRE-family HTH domain
LTNAEFKTIRQQVGLSTEQLAKLLNLEPESIRRWEQGVYTIPSEAIEVLLLMQKNFLTMLKSIIDGYDSLIKNNPTVKEVVLIRYHKDDFEKWNGKKFGPMPEGFHARLVVGLYDHILTKEYDLKVLFVSFDPEKYTAYLQENKLTDSERNRAAWASSI